MQIRKAIIEDVRNIIEVVQASYKFSYRGYLPDEYLDDLSITDDVFEKWKNYINKKESYVAEHQNQIVAFMMLDSSSEECFEICILYVKPENQKIGFGSSLVNYAFDIKKSSGYKRCELWTIKNGPSMGFYNKVGFIMTGEEKSWKFDIPIVRMIKGV